MLCDEACMFHTEKLIDGASLHGTGGDGSIEGVIGAHAFRGKVCGAGGLGQLLGEANKLRPG